MYAAEVEAAMNGDEDSSDGEYDEAAMEADARAAECATASMMHSLELPTDRPKSHLLLILTT